MRHEFIPVSVLLDKYLREEFESELSEVERAFIWAHERIRPGEIISSSSWRDALLQAQINVLYREVYRTHRKPGIIDDEVTDAYSDDDTPLEVTVMRLKRKFLNRLDELK
jgi:hypothetical protein